VFHALLELADKVVVCKVDVVEERVGRVCGCYWGRWRRAMMLRLEGCYS
jgi:hypothetical protein